MSCSAGPARAVRLLLASWLLSLLGTVAPASGQITFLMGQVLDDEGAPVDGALVVASREETGSERFETRSDRNGRFAIVGLRSGIWVFTATARGFVPGRQAARVSMGRTQSAVEIRLQRPVEVPTVLGDIDAGALQAELAQARALLAADRSGEAVAAYRAVLARVPALTALHLQIAQAHRQAGDYDAAMAAYRSAITGEDRVSARARVDLAVMEIERGKLLLQRLP